VDDEVSFSVSFPLDAEGFLRRECPSCSREFKWLEQEEGEPMPADGYACPYCGSRSPSDGWFTRGQERIIEAAVDENVISPQLRGLEETFSDLEKSSGGLLSARIERQPRQRPSRLSERNDMRRVDFVCHPTEPVKVLEDWNGPVHCLICGPPQTG
jgi:hypothetical protein